MASIAGGVGPIILFTLIVLTILIIIIILAFRFQIPDAGESGRVNCSGLPPPSNVDAVSFQLTNVRLTWNAIGDAREYIIFVGTIPDVRESTSIQQYNVPGNQNEFVISNLILGRTYYFKMKSVNACGNTSGFSGESSATLGFPPVFRIVSRDQPTLGLRVANNLIDVELASFCTGDPGDTRCLWTYDNTNGYISSIDSPSICMTGKPTSQDSEVAYAPCSELIFAFFKSYGVWNYQPSDGSFCHNDDGSGNNCIAIANDNTNLLTTAFSGLPDMQWDIVEFND